MSNGMLAYLGALLGNGQNNTPSGGDDMFIINGTIERVDDEFDLTIDKTLAEIAEAYTGGQIPIIIADLGNGFGTILRLYETRVVEEEYSQFTFIGDLNGSMTSRFRAVVLVDSINFYIDTLGE